MGKTTDFFTRGWGDLLIGLAALLWALFAMAEWPEGTTLFALGAALAKLCSWQIAGPFALAALGRGVRRLTGAEPGTPI